MVFGWWVAGFVGERCEKGVAPLVNLKGRYRARKEIWLTPEIIKSLIHNKESETLDFKRDQYPFYNCDRNDKAELLKDILAFANAWKTADAYILIGVDEAKAGPATLVGVTEHLKDSDLQQFVNTKTNRPIKLLCGTVDIDGTEIDVIQIDCNQERPVVLESDFSNLTKDTVYLRRGSSTEIAKVDEIAEMGAARIQSGPSIPEIEFELANPSKREKYGLDIGITSILLVDPPSPPSLSLDEIKNNPAYSGILKDMMKFTNIQKQVEWRHGRPFMANSFLPRGPSPEWIKKYRTEIAVYSGIGFWLKNTGGVSATDVRVQIKGNRENELLLADDDGLPEKPCGPLEGIHPIKNRMLDVQVQSYEGYWVASIHVGKIQPQAEVWIDDLLYIGSKTPMTCEAEARIFADNLPSPVEYKIRINIETKEHVYEEVVDSDEIE